MTTKVSAKAKAVLQAYDNVFSDGYGAIVLEDMRESFHDRSDADDDGELDHIPPEARIWFRAGMRHVYLSITRAIALNRDAVSESSETNTTSDRSEL